MAHYNRKYKPHKQQPFTPGAPALKFYLRVSFEVSLVKRLEVALVRAWGSGLASWWDRVGDVGGAE